MLKLSPLLAVLIFAPSTASAQFRIRTLRLAAPFAGVLPALPSLPSARLSLQSMPAPLPPLGSSPMGLGGGGKDATPPKPSEWTRPPLSFQRAVPEEARTILANALLRETAQTLGFVLSIGVDAADVNDLNFEVRTHKHKGSRRLFGVLVKRRGGAGVTLGGFEAAFDEDSGELSLNDKIDDRLRRAFRGAARASALPAVVKIRLPGNLRSQGIDEKFDPATARWLATLFRHQARPVLEYLKRKGVDTSIAPLSYGVHANLTAIQAMELAALLPVETILKKD